MVRGSVERRGSPGGVQGPTHLPACLPGPGVVQGPTWVLDLLLRVRTTGTHRGPGVEILGLVVLEIELEIVGITWDSFD